MRHVFGPAGRWAVILPGSASTSDFVARSMGPALAAVGIGLVSADPRELGGPAAQLAALGAAARRWRPVLVGGVSLGAHLALRWAAGRADGEGPEGLLLAMPAWTGAPGPVAAASAFAADEVAGHGIAGALDRIRERAAGVPEAGWVIGELAAAWPRYSPGELASALRATAGCPGPDPAELAAITVPCGIVALRDDPLHPVDVAREWAARIGQSALVETHLAAVGADRATLGRGAVLAWLRASEGGRRVSRSR